MNAERLLQHFERISEAPDAIVRLRRFVLDLAVSGKLVEQDPNDEPAAELLIQIEAERMRLVAGKKIRNQQSPPQVKTDEQLFAIPASWRWVRFGAIADFSAGRTPPRHEASFWNTGDYPWVSIADMADGGVVHATKETISEKAKEQVFKANPCSAGTMIMSFKLTIGKIAILGVPAFHNEAIISIYPHLPSLGAYLFKALPKFSRQGEAKDAIKGATLNRDSIGNIFLPLPPLAEQHRIVAKVDELMTLCDQLEAARAEREQRRDQLVRASLRRLATADDDGDALREHATFALDNLAELTTRAEHIKQLRETIRNLAVCGKLVSQSTYDEPAAELLKNVQSMKTALVKSGLISHSKVRADIPKLAFELPSNWKAIRFDDVCTLVTSGSRGWAEHYAETGPIFVRAQNIRFGRLRLDDLACVNPPAKSEGRRTKIEKGDLLVVITGAGVTNPALIDRDLGEAYVSQHVALIRPAVTTLSRWLLLCLMAGMGGRDELVERAYGAGKPGLNLDNIRTLSLPLPPLAEQERILAKVDELMTLCDNLEMQLSNAGSDSDRLLEAVLHETLTAPELAETA
ncbi:MULTISPECIES: restriction endonuclease subunit S [Burkholderia]|uniref:restriction endonuclease subunit S n=1 Tax=Burkholderia TaxID=32008 RepID=UPI000977397D|nr:MULTISPECIES: restriction endonuclease subunit S [Burkholderia]MCM2549242.1 restriction endonuclease subunit S [Burkholderia glumae]